MRTGHFGLLGATLLVGVAQAALAQPVATYNPDQLPATQGRVAQYSLTPRGDVDGIILQDGTQVHMPPHLGGELAQAVKPGDAVVVRGLKAQALPLIQGLSITGEATGQTVTDDAPPPRQPPPIATTLEWLEVQGRVKEPLYGPRGDMNGALLEDGAQVHLPPDQAARRAASLQPGQALAAEGYGVKGPYGTSLEAQRIGVSETQLVQIEPPGPPGRRPPPGPGHDAPPPPPLRAAGPFAAPPPPDAPPPPAPR